MIPICIFCQVDAVSYIHVPSIPFFCLYRNLRLVRFTYQPPVSSTFLSKRTSHRQLADSTFLSKQTSTSNQPNEQAVEHIICSVTGTTTKAKGKSSGWCIAD
jgi:hypothetical protein